MAKKLRGGVLIGPLKYFGWYGSPPFGTLQVDPDRITLSLWPVVCIFERSDILGLYREPAMWRDSVRIVHRKQNYVKWTLFITSDFKAAESLLHENGFQVQPSGSSIPDISSIKYSKLYW